MACVWSSEDNFVKSVLTTYTWQYALNTDCPRQLMALNFVPGLCGRAVEPLECRAQPEAAHHRGPVGLEVSQPGPFPLGLCFLGVDVR